MELHPEPFYTCGGSASWGCPTLDTIPKRGSSDDLTLRFIDDPTQHTKAQRNVANGRYVVSVGPDHEHTYSRWYYNLSATAFTRLWRYCSRNSPKKMLTFPSMTSLYYALLLVIKCNGCFGIPPGTIRCENPPPFISRFFLNMLCQWIFESRNE